MARKRIPRLRLSHGAWYHVTGTPQKWTRLSDRYDEALRMYAERETQFTNKHDVAALLAAFIAASVGKKSEVTVKDYRCFAKMPTKVFGHLPPQVITRPLAVKYMEDHASISMARHEVALLSAALNWGMERGWPGIASNPLYGWNKGKRSKRMRLITAPEWTAILGHLRPDCAKAVKLLRFTALRVRDGLALKWSDVKGGELIAKVSKTKNGVRFAGAELESLLRDMKTQSVVSFKLMTCLNGRAMTYTTLRRHWKAAAALAGCPDVTIHDIRRMRLTELQNLYGVEFAQKVAAHSDPKTTRGYYADLPRVVL